LYGDETWALRKVDQKYLKSFEIWYWRRMDKIIWTDLLRNEEVLQNVQEERNTLKQEIEGRLIGFVTSCIGTAF
jgi:hypothetical protein